MTKMEQRVKKAEALYDQDLKRVGKRLNLKILDIISHEDLNSKPFQKKVLNLWKKNKNVAIIINSDDREKEGEHWQALWFGPSQLEFFDPYGLPPVQRATHDFIQKMKERMGVKDAFNMEPVQDMSNTQSNACGYHCLLYLWLRNRIPSHVTIHDMLDVFYSKNFSKNDLIAVDFVNKKMLN